MKNTHKLGVVIRHEYKTIVKQVSFWAVLILVPLIFAVIIGASYISDKTSKDQDQNANAKDKHVVVIDKSKLINTDIAKTLNLTIDHNAPQSELVDQVKNGQLDGLIVYPQDVAKTQQYEVYANNDESNNSNKLSTIGKTALQQSVLAPLGSNELSALATSGGQSEITSFKNGKESKGFGSYVLPGSFLLLFYMVLVFSVSYALTSVSDEKENRSIEMVLSYIKPQTLILGKLFGVILVTLTQILFFALIGLVGYLIARILGNQLSLPFDLSDITVDPMALIFGISFLVLGFIFYVGLMATTGAIFPSAKDAGGFTTVFFLAAASPFWSFSTISNNPDSIITQIMTYFPLTAPTTSLIRNTFGNLSATEGLISLIILAISTVATIMLAGKAFRLGTLQYNSRINFRDLFSRKV